MLALALLCARSTALITPHAPKHLPARLAAGRFGGDARAARANVDKYASGRAVRATDLGGRFVLTPDTSAAAVARAGVSRALPRRASRGGCREDAPSRVSPPQVAFVAFECVLAAQKCPAKTAGDLCGIETIRDWNPDLTTGGVPRGRPRRASRGLW